MRTKLIDGSITSRGGEGSNTKSVYFSGSGKERDIPLKDGGVVMLNS